MKIHNSITWAVALLCVALGYCLGVSVVVLFFYGASLLVLVLPVGALLYVFFRLGRSGSGITFGAGEVRKAGEVETHKQ